MVNIVRYADVCTQNRVGETIAKTPQATHHHPLQSTPKRLLTAALALEHTPDVYFITVASNSTHERGAI